VIHKVALKWSLCVVVGVLLLGHWDLSVTLLVTVWVREYFDASHHAQGKIPWLLSRNRWWKL